MGMAGINNFEQEARERKAQALFIIFRDKNATVHQLENLDEIGWTTAAKYAKVHYPSDATKALVIEKLRAFEDCMNWKPARHLQVVR